MEDQESRDREFPPPPTINTHWPIRGTLVPLSIPRAVDAAAKTAVLLDSARRYTMVNRLPKRIFRHQVTFTPPIEDIDESFAVVSVLSRQIGAFHFDGSIIYTYRPTRVDPLIARSVDDKYEIRVQRVNILDPCNRRFWNMTSAMIQSHLDCVHKMVKPYMETTTTKIRHL